MPILPLTICAVLLLATSTFADTAVAPPAVASPSRQAPLVAAGGPQIVEAVRSSGAAVVVVNLWATWCTPCREEFPDLMRLYRTYKDRGVKLVLVSGDFASESAAASEFLATQGVDFASYLKSGKDEEFINAFDPKWSGALPATFVYDAKGERRHSVLGPVTFDSLERVVAPLLGAAP
ncbi:MAG: TlpA family protein disulfide reductase [Candidatus Binatia bacterium]